MPDVTAPRFDVRSRFLTGAVSNSIGKFGPVIVWFFLTPVMLREIGAVGYSVWVLVGSMAAYAYLLDLGVGGAVVKYVAEHSATGRTQETRALCATAVQLYLFLAALLVTVSVVFAPALADAFGQSGVERATVIWLVILIGLSVAVTLATTPATSILQGKHRFDLYSFITGGGSVLMAGLSAIALFAGWGLIGLASASLMATAVMRGTAVVMARRIAPELELGWRGADWGLLRQVFVFSSSSFAMFLSTRLNTKSDEFVIAAFLPLAAVTPYALGRKLGEIGQQVSAQIVKTVMPLASELDARQEPPRLRSLYLAATRITLAAFIPVALIISVQARAILEAWVGAEYADAAPIVVVLAVAGLIGTSQWSGQAVMEGLAEHRPIAIALLLGGVANIVASIVLVQTMGLLGVALATLITTTIVALGVILPRVLRRLEVSYRDAFLQTWMPVLVPAIPSGIAIHLLSSTRFAGDIATLLIASTAGGLIYASIYLAFPGTAMERDTILQLLRGTARLVPGLRPR